MKFFDDIAIGDVTEFGSHTFTAEAIKRFAGAYDPQPFHLDEEAAATGLFGALTASGWHTMAVMMKLIDAAGGPLPAGAADGADCARLGPSPGFDDLRWLRPVFAGGTLTYRATVTGKRESRSRPGWGQPSQSTLMSSTNGVVSSSIRAAGKSSRPIIVAVPQSSPLAVSELQM